MRSAEWQIEVTLKIEKVREYPGGGLRHRIVSTLAKWLAAQDSFYAQPAAPGRTVLFDRLFGVLRAARRKPAMLPQHRTQEQLVHAYHGEKNLFHI
jgi:hypothetical protein